MKKILKVLLILVLALVLVVCGLCGFLTITEYKPEEIEMIEFEGNPLGTLSVGTELTLLSYDMAWCGVSADLDTFEDGGELSKSPTTSLVKRNLEGMSQLMKVQDCDIYFLQEVDEKASRSHDIDMVTYLKTSLNGVSSFATDYVCKFVPMPLTSPTGHVNSGVMTICDYEVTESARYAMPENSKWPFKAWAPKHCLLVDRLPIEGGGELILVNVHFSDGSDSQTKIDQSRFLANFACDEYAKGNYVIIGGCFNQTFPNANPGLYPIRNTSNFMPGILESSLFGYDWIFAYDEKTPSARLANAPYNEFDPYMQFYVIDGYVLSPNITLKGVFTIDTDFKYSSHQPVKLRVKIGKEAAIEPEPEDELML